ncbi:hypothetical protein B5V91_00595, partial [Heyndrickxia sporothermodurans]
LTGMLLINFIFCRIIFCCPGYKEHIKISKKITQIDKILIYQGFETYQKIFFSDVCAWSLSPPV